jgi:uncharacterized protein (TIGR02757 family)|tara:strand:- start:29436 stop:30185 length:750 start_codon:yes stop_codon:yes gene_type:complete
MNLTKAKSQLDSILENLNPQDFIENDPISIPHRFTQKEDIEIAAFFAAILAWGQRKTIINNANKLMHWMGEEPHRFIVEHSDSELKQFEKFVHRTFNSTDVLYFIEVLKQWYSNGKSLEDYFVGGTMKDRIANFHQSFFTFDFAPARTRKHIANPAKNSSAKRLNMYLRWMVRNDGLDFGIWHSIKYSELKCPLDVHVQRAAFHFGLLTRKQQDWKAVEELSDNLLSLDAVDPIKYDLALFKWSEAKMD